MIIHPPLQSLRKDAARQRRKMQERSAAEVRAIEEERAQQPGGPSILICFGYN